MLSLRNVYAGYGPMNILEDVSLDVSRGEIVCLLGANGAGKSTLLRAISALIPCRRGKVCFEGRSLVGLEVEAIVRQGVSHVPEGREIFSALTVAENLRLGAFTRRDGHDAIEISRQRIFRLFPVIQAKQDRLAGTLSGGEQQMLAVGRALMGAPRFL